MERLTRRLENGKIRFRGRLPNFNYFADSLVGMDCYNEYCNALYRLAQYEDVEEQGRLIVLPDNYDEIYNKRGDNIYAIIDGDLHELLMTDTFIGKEHKLMIDCFEIDDVWVEEGGEPVEKEMPKTYGFPICDVGKSVFFSQEEAEKALEWMK